MIMFNPTNNPDQLGGAKRGLRGTGPKEAWIRVYPHPAQLGLRLGLRRRVRSSSRSTNRSPSRTAWTSSRFSWAEKARAVTSPASWAASSGTRSLRPWRRARPSRSDGYSLNVPTSRQCKGDPIAVVIHGKNDNVVGPENGPATRDFYAELNNCGTETMPVAGLHGHTLQLCRCTRAATPAIRSSGASTPTRTTATRTTAGPRSRPSSCGRSCPSIELTDLLGAVPHRSLEFLSPSSSKLGG